MSRLLTENQFAADHPLLSCMYTWHQPRRRRRTDRSNHHGEEAHMRGFRSASPTWPGCSKHPNHAPGEGRGVPATWGAPQHDRRWRRHQQPWCDAQPKLRSHPRPGRNEAYTCTSVTGRYGRHRANHCGATQCVVSARLSRLLAEFQPHTRSKEELRKAGTEWLHSGPESETRNHRRGKERV